MGRDALVCLVYLVLSWSQQSKGSEVCDESVSDKLGEYYTGCQDTTIYGKPCQWWNSTKPHQHHFTSETHGSKGIGDHRYCRNPDGSDTIWCFTSDEKKRREPCIPKVVCNTTKCLPTACHWMKCGTNGTCRPVQKVNGSPCDDKNATTVNDICIEGKCQGEDPCKDKECPPALPCHEPTFCIRSQNGRMSLEVGMCSTPEKVSRRPCDDGDPTTKEDRCWRGACIGSCGKKSCKVFGPLGPCKRYTCRQGICIKIDKKDKTPCDDGLVATTGDECHSGLCRGYCNGINEPCLVEQGISLGDGSCTDGGCTEGLICSIPGSCYNFWKSRGLKNTDHWPNETRRRGWDRLDRCCLHQHDCDGRCTDRCGQISMCNKKPLCSCKADCSKGPLKCCADYLDTCISLGTEDTPEQRATKLKLLNQYSAQDDAMSRWWVVGLFAVLIAAFAVYKKREKRRGAATRLM